ncbi:transcription factor HES-3 [Mauremys mutica]|uniref:transcription factor HES-3 n=1 Tax=Mauremys mutica TaxID=74926 RepID=UPI001D166A90|nr:transcription factor HES-3 [Mauremys mutica]
MEKKRRARINVSLEQLKALLEKHYSHHIRKRKLEKADILELSVKYMKSLQNSVQGKSSVALPGHGCSFYESLGASVARRLGGAVPALPQRPRVSLEPPEGGAEKPAGFRSCLHGVNQFLLRSEGACEASSFHLLQELARASPRVSGSGCRTTDSSPIAPRPEPRGSRPGGRAAEQRGPLQKAGGSTQRPRAPSSQPRTEPGAAAPRRGPAELRPSVPSRSQALWRPW